MSSNELANDVGLRRMKVLLIQRGKRLLVSEHQVRSARRVVRSVRGLSTHRIVGVSGVGGVGDCDFVI